MIIQPTSSTASSSSSSNGARTSAASSPDVLRPRVRGGRAAVHVAQANLSFNRLAGTLRGLHYQRPPAAEAKLVRCTRGTRLRRRRRRPAGLAQLPPHVGVVLDPG
jgi:hypothetical protein